MAPERMRQGLSKHLGARCGSGWADGGSDSDPPDEASCQGDIKAASGSVKARCAGAPRHESRGLSSARHEHATRRRTKQAGSVPTAPVGLHCAARCPPYPSRPVPLRLPAPGAARGWAAARTGEMRHMRLEAAGAYTRVSGRAVYPGCRGCGTLIDTPSFIYSIGCRRGGCGDGGKSREEQDLGCGDLR